MSSHGWEAGRTRSDEITIFDNTGTGIQDVAAAARAYEIARAHATTTGITLA